MARFIFYNNPPGCYMKMRIGAGRMEVRDKRGGWCYVQMRYGGPGKDYCQEDEEKWSDSQ